MNWKEKSTTGYMLINSFRQISVYEYIYIYIYISFFPFFKNEKNVLTREIWFYFQSFLIFFQISKHFFDLL